MTKKVLVTGADGFIGSHLSEYLVARGHDVTASLQRMSLCPKALAEWLETKEIEKSDLRRSVFGGI